MLFTALVQTSKFRTVKSNHIVLEPVSNESFLTDSGSSRRTRRSFCLVTRSSTGPLLTSADSENIRRFGDAATIFTLEGSSPLFIDLSNIAIVTCGFVNFFFDPLSELLGNEEQLYPTVLKFSSYVTVRYSFPHDK